MTVVLDTVTVLVLTSIDTVVISSLIVVNDELSVFKYKVDSLGTSLENDDCSFVVSSSVVNIVVSDLLTE